MKALTRPYWVILTVTLPSLLAILYYLGVYGVIATLLESEHLARWQWGAGVLSTIAVVSTLYPLWLRARGGRLDWRYGVAILLLYGGVLFAYLSEGMHLLPRSVSAWMISEDEFFLLPFGLMVPALLHGLLLLVDRFTRPDARRALLKATLGAIAVPAFWYLALRALFPLLGGNMSWDLYQHMRDILFIVAGVAFIFMMLRLLYLLVLKVPRTGRTRFWLLRLPFTIVLPLLCLLVYNGKLPLLDKFMGGELHPFGDWSHPGYYLLALINGVLLSLPRPGSMRLQLALFLGKGSLYPVTLYFFIVLLPFLPFALPLVVFYGIGLLLLTPMLLFIIQTFSLVEEWQLLAAHYRLRLVVPLFAAAAALAPSLLTAHYWADRSTLDTMLSHVYEPDLTATQPLQLDLASARRVLDHIHLLKAGGDFFSGKRKPYLTSYYQWMVLDSLTLSDKRLATLEQIFFGSVPDEPREWRAPTPSCSTELAAAESSTRLSPDGHYFISQLDLTIRNTGGDGCEYTTRFKLPIGAWVRNYYLMIDGQRVDGLLAERKSALWLYQQIRDTRRDPGLLYYSGAEELTLRIFPFAAGESRHSGIEIIHREPLTMTLDKRIVELRTTQPLWPSTTAAPGGIHWVSASQKSLLPHLQRTPYLHFVVDRSLRGERRLEAYSQRIDAFLSRWQQQGYSVAGARVSVVNHAVQTIPLEHDWQARAEAIPAQGGFFLQRALQQGLDGNYRQHLARYPLFVVITDHLQAAVVGESLTGGALLAPEGESFLLPDSTGGVMIHRMDSPFAGRKMEGMVPPCQPVVAWPSLNQPRAYLRDDGNASLVMELATGVDVDSVATTEWGRGLALYGAWLATRLAPYQASRRETRLVRQSFDAHLLTPVTAFISTENEAQRQVLRRKQAEMLAAARPLDVGEEHHMDEPALWWGLPLLALIAGRRRLMAAVSAGVGNQNKAILSCIKRC